MLNLRYAAAGLAAAAVAASSAILLAPAATAQIDPTSCASTATELLKVRTADNGNHDRVTVAERRSTDAQNELHAAQAAYKADPSADNAQRLKASQAEADRRRAYLAEVDTDLRHTSGELMRISVLVDQLCDVNGGATPTIPPIPPTNAPVPVVPTIPPTDINPPAESNNGGSSSSSGAATSQVGEVPGGQGVQTGGGALAPFVA